MKTFLSDPTQDEMLPFKSLKKSVGGTEGTNKTKISDTWNLGFCY